MEGYTETPVDYDPFAGSPPPVVKPDEPVQLDPAASAEAISRDRFLPKYTEEPVDYDPFEEGSFVPEAAKAFARGVTTTTGLGLKGIGADLATGPAGEAKTRLAIMDAIDRGETPPVPPITWEDPLDVYNTYKDMTPEQKQQLRASQEKVLEVNPQQDVTKSPLYQAGELIEESGKKAYAAARDYENSWTSLIGEGFGSTLPFLLTRGKAGLAAGYEVSVGGQIEDALAHGAKPDQIMDVIATAGIPGLTERAPLDALFSKIPVGRWGKFADVLLKTSSQVLAEGGQEGLQQFLSNLNAKRFYDPDRDSFEGVALAATVGGIVGGGMAAPVATADVLTRPKTAATPQPSADQTGADAGAAEVTGQPTPGASTSATAPQPVAAPPSTTDPTQAKPVAPGSSAVTVVPPGSPDPALAAAASPSSAAAGPAPAPSSPPAPVQLAAAEDEDIEEGVIPEKPTSLTPEQIAKKQREAAVRKANIEALNATSPVPQDLAAAVAGGQPAPAPQPPVTPMPEPLPTAQAAVNRPAPAAPAIAPVVSPPPPASVAPVGAAPTVEGITPAQQPSVPAPKARRARKKAVAPPAAIPEAAEFTAQPPAAALTPPSLAPTEAQPAPLPSVAPAAPVEEEDPALAAARARIAARAAAAGKAAEVPPPQPAVQAEPQPPRVPAATPAPVAPKITAEVPITPAPAKPEPQPAVKAKPSPAARALEEHMFQELAAQKRSAPRELVRQVAQEHAAGAEKEPPAKAARERVGKAMQALKERQEREEVEKAAREEEKHARGVKAAAKRERASESKEKPAEAIAEESDDAIRRAIKAELEKPEAERDPDILELRDVLAERKKLRGRGKEREEKRAELTEKVKQIQARRAESVAKRAETKAAEPAAEPAKAEKKGPQRTAPEALGKAITDVKPPDFNRIPSMAKFRAAGKEYMAGVAAAVEAHLKATGTVLPEQTDVRHNSAEENLALLAQKGTDPQKFVTALMFYQAGETQELRNLLKSEVQEGTSAKGVEGFAEIISSGEKEAQRRTREHYDEAPPAPMQQRKPRRMITSTLGELEQSDFYYPPNQRTEVKVRDHNGNPITIQTHARFSASELLDLVSRETAEFPLFERGGYHDLIAKLTNKALKGMVGDVQVYFITDATTEKVRGQSTAGFYVGQDSTSRARGVPDAIFINIESFLQGGHAWRQHLLLHEITHAATVEAYHENINGAGRAIDAMMDAVEAQLKRIGKWDAILFSNLDYAFKNGREFIAEAFSNPEFQTLLQELPVSVAARPAIEASVARGNSWMRTFVNLIRRAIGLPTGRNEAFTNYLEQMVRLMPSAFLSTKQQRQYAIEDVIIHGASSTEELVTRQPRDALDFNPMFGRMRQIWSERQLASGGIFRSGSRVARQKVQTTRNIRRLSERYWGGKDNPLSKLIDAVMRAGTKVRTAAKAGNELLSNIADVKRRYVTEYKQAQEILFDATVGEYNPMEALGHETNKHISKKGVLDEHKRAAHAEGHAAWQKLRPEVRAPLKAWVDYMRNLEQTRMKKLVRNMLREKENTDTLSYPTGETRDSVVDWVLDGGIDRDPKRTIDPKEPDVAKLTKERDRDVLLHAALGKTAKSLKNTKRIGQVRGVYVPLMRRGKLFFTARHKITPPAGAILKKDDDGNDTTTLMFNDKKKLKAFLQTAHQGEFTQVRGKARAVHIDPTTGEEVSAKDANAQTFYEVDIQNRFMGTGDNEAVLNQLASEMKAAGWETSLVGQIDTDLNKDSEILPNQVRRLLRSADNAADTEHGTRALNGAIIDAYIRQLSGNRAAHRRLKRTGVKGYDRDLLRNSRDVHDAMVGHVTNLDTAPEIAELERAARKHMEGVRKGDYAAQGPFQYREMQAQLNEVLKRGNKANNSGGSHGVDDQIKVLTDASFITHLATPAYTAANLTGGQLIGHAVLSSESNPITAGAAMWKAGRKLSGIKVLAKGLVDTVRAIKGGATPDWAAAVRAKTADGSLEQQFVDQLEELGLGVGSGLETSDVTGIGSTFLGSERAALVHDRGMRMARAMPEAAETVNRYVVGFAALDIAQQKGLSGQEALDFAIDAVEKTQGGYGAENNPALFNTRLGRIVFQFKKYPLMIGQLYYSSIYNLFYQGGYTSAQSRKMAAKQLLYTSAAMVMMSGIGGLPFMELGRIFSVIASMFGGDDWDENENQLQEAIASLTGDKISEATMHGLSRLFGVDLSNRLGNENLLLFGEPDSTKENDVKAWVFDTLAGAPGGMVGDALKGIGKLYNEGDVSKLGQAILPKFMSDAWKATQAYQEGPKTKAGREYASPLTGPEAVSKALGFKPATEAQRYESGGTSAKFFAQEKLKLERSRLMGDWKGGPMGADILRWNRDHPKMKISYDSLRRSKRAREQKAKELAD